MTRATATAAHQHASSSPGDVETTREGGVLVLTMARPEKRNALSEGMLASLQAALDSAARDPDVRAVIIAAKGPAFCSGHDLKELTAHRADADKGRAYIDSLMRTCARMMRSIVTHPKPVIAAVQGIASAAGCQLVASCDLAVAADHAQFCTPGVNIGLFCSTPMVALSRNVPRKRAMELILTGERIDAQAAERLGLITRVVPRDRLDAEVHVLCDKLIGKSPLVMQMGLDAYHRMQDLELEAALRYLEGELGRVLGTDDAAEGLMAFLQKRAPSWKGK